MAEALQVRTAELYSCIIYCKVPSIHALCVKYNNVHGPTSSIKIKNSLASFWPSCRRRCVASQSLFPSNYSTTTCTCTGMLVLLKTFSCHMFSNERAAVLNCHSTIAFNVQCNLIFWHPYFSFRVSTSSFLFQFPFLCSFVYSFLSTCFFSYLSLEGQFFSLIPIL